MSLPFDINKINTQLTEALDFITRYRRNTFPLVCNTLYLFPNAFHRVAGRQDYFSTESATSEAASVLAVAFFRAYEATGNVNWRTLAKNTIDAFANYFYIDNIFTTTNQGINTPLVRQHWLIVAYGSVTTENQQIGTDPFNFGTFGSANFTNGVAQLPSSLSKVFKVYNGILHYKNMYAPLRSGTEYSINYYVREGLRIYSNGTRQTTAEPNGKVVLNNLAISENLQVLYCTKDGTVVNSLTAPLTGESLYEPYPIAFKAVVPGRIYTSAATDTFWWIDEAFRLAHIHTGETKYLNAAEITKWNTIKYLVENVIESYYYRKESSDDPLRYPGSYTLQYNVNINNVPQTLPGYSQVRETSGDKAKFIKLTINANNNLNHFSGVELQNYVTQLLFDPLVSIFIEAAINISTVLEIKLSLSPDSNDFSQEWIANWFLVGNSTINQKTFQFRSFFKWGSGNVWHTRIAENPVFVYNSATWEYTQEILPREIDTAIVKVTMPTSSDGCGLINGKFSNTIPNIYYKLSGNVQIRFKDSQNNFYFTNLPDSGGSWLTFTGSWGSLFGVSDRLITEIVFQNSGTNQAVLNLFYVGDAPQFLPVPSRVYKGSVTSKDRRSHILWIGDFKPNNNPLDKKAYRPGAINFVLNTLNSALSGYQGEQYYIGYQSPYTLDVWGYKNYAKNVVKLFNDSQESYTNQSASRIRGLFHQVYLPYSPENIPYLTKLTTTKKVLKFPIPFLFAENQQFPTDSYQFDTFSWQGLDPNTEWSPYCFRAMEDLSKYYFNNQNDSIARKVLTEYVKFSHSWCINNPGQQITNIRPNLDPTSTYFEPHAAALEGLTFLNCNAAGIEKDLTYELIQIKFNYIDNQFVSSGNMRGCWCKNQPTFTSEGQTYQEFFSFWMGKIIEFYSKCLTMQSFITKSNVQTLNYFPLVLADANGNLPGNNFAHFIESISEPEYPIITQTYTDGNEQRVLLTNYAVNKKIILKYQNLQANKTKDLIDFYNLVNKEYNGKFLFDTSKITYSDFAGTWRFLEPPTIDLVVSNASRGIYNISMQIERIE